MASFTCVDLIILSLLSINSILLMCWILGQCIAKFPDDPSVTSVLFDLETIRSKQQSEFVSLVKADAFKNIAERKFTLTDIIDVDSDGLAELGYYLA